MPNLEQFTINDPKKLQIKDIPSSVVINKKIPIEAGVEKNAGNQKSLVEATLTLGEESINKTLVIKEFDNREEALDELRKVLDLEKHSVPVPDVYGVVFDDESGKWMLLYEDLSNGGENFVWSVSNNQEEFAALSLSERDLTSIDQQLSIISGQAATAGYILEADTFFLVKDRQSTDNPLRVITGDFGLGCKKSLARADLVSALNSRNSRDLLSGIRHLQENSPST